MLNQFGQPVVATFGCKRMDGVVKRRHMKYASLCSLLNFKFRSVTSSGTGSSEQFIRALSLLFYLDGTLPQTNKVYHRAFDENQKYSKYLGSASNHQRGCQNFPPIIQGRHMCGSSQNAKLSRHRWVQWLENTFHFNYNPVYTPDQNSETWNQTSSWDMPLSVKLSDLGAWKATSTWFFLK